MTESQSLYSEEVKEKPPTTSVWEDFIDIFYAPSQVFARRARSGFGVPMLVVTVLIGALALVNGAANDAALDADMGRAQAKAMAQAAAKGGPQPSAAQMETIRNVSHTMSKIGLFVLLPIGMLLIGVVVALVGKMFDASVTVGAGIMIASYAYIPRILEGVINCIQALFVDTSTITSRLNFSLGVGRFLDPDTTPPVLLGLLARVDVFTIWVTVLIAIGLSVVGKIPMKKAALAAVVVWFVGALAIVLPALASG
jgi:hypothetical protein